MAKWIKNDTAGTKTYLGQDILAAAYYQIQPHEEIAWANDSTLITDIGSGDAIVSTTNAAGGHITDVSDAVNHLKDNLPKEVIGIHDLQKSLDNELAFLANTNLNDISGVSESDYFYLKNPAASGKNLIVTHISLGVDETSVRSILRVYKNPTISADGTALTEVNTHFKASPVVAKGEAFRAPTQTARGALLNIVIVPTNNPSRGLNRFYVIPPDKGMLITVENSIANASTFVECLWIEESE